MNTTIDIAKIACNIENADDIYKYTNYSLVFDLITPVFNDIDLFHKQVDIGNNVNVYLGTATFFTDEDFNGLLDIFIQVKSDDRERVIDLLEQDERAKQMVIQRLYELVDALNTSYLNISVPIDHLDNCKYIDSANAFFNKIGEPTPTMVKPRFTYDEADDLFTYFL